MSAARFSLTVHNRGLKKKPIYSFIHGLKHHSLIAVLVDALQSVVKLLKMFCHFRKGSVNVHFSLVLLDSMFTEQTVLKVLQEGFSKRQDVSKLNIANPEEDIRLIGIVASGPSKVIYVLKNRIKIGVGMTECFVKHS